MRVIGAVVLVAGVVLIGAATIARVQWITSAQYLPKAAEQSANSTPSTLSPLELQQGEGATTAPSKDLQTYQGAGYTIDIPPSFIFDGLVANSYPWDLVSWHSAVLDQVIGVEWQQYSSNSQIKRTEDATVSANNDTRAVVSHPAIPGAASSTMIESGIHPNAPATINLWVIGTNGNVYCFYGLASSPAALASVKKIIASVSLAPGQP
jgi:hypothetical protein